MGQQMVAVDDRDTVLESARQARAKSEDLRHRARRLGLHSIALRYRVGRLTRWYCGEIYAMAESIGGSHSDGSRTGVAGDGRLDGHGGAHARGALVDGAGAADSDYWREDVLAGALTALIDAVQQSSAEERLLLTSVANLRRALTSGASVTETLAAEIDPGTVKLLSRVLSRLMEASGTARRELARSMRAEGTSIPAIARVFGVTHQRISNILNSNAPGSTDGPVRSGQRIHVEQDGGR